MADYTFTPADDIVVEIGALNPGDTATLTKGDYDIADNILFDGVEVISERGVVINSSGAVLVSDLTDALFTGFAVIESGRILINTSTIKLGAVSIVSAIDIEINTDAGTVAVGNITGNVVTRGDISFSSDFILGNYTHYPTEINQSMRSYVGIMRGNIYVSGLTSRPKITVGVMGGNMTLRAVHGDIIISDTVTNHAYTLHVNDSSYVTVKMQGAPIQLQSNDTVSTIIVSGVILNELYTYSDILLEDLDISSNTFSINSPSEVSVSVGAGVDSSTLLSKISDTISLVYTGGKDEQRLRWVGEWTGGRYLVNDLVRDGEYTMAASTDTADRPAPQPIGAELYLYQGTITPITVSAKQIIIGARATSISNSGYLNGYRVYTHIGSFYETYWVENPLGTPIFHSIDTFTGTIDGWFEVALPQSILNAGATFDIIARITEADPAPAEVLANYDYTKPQNDAIPDSGEISQSGKTPSSFRVHYTDSDATDRTALIRNLTVGDTIFGAGVEWTIQANTDNTTWADLEVSPALQGSPTGVQSFAFRTVVVQDIDTGQDIDYWLTHPTVKGLIAIDDDYADITVTNDAYGIDMLLQDILISDDWDVVAFSGGVASGGGGDSGVTIHNALTGRDVADTHPVSSITGLDAALGNKLNTSVYDAHIIDYSLHLTPDQNDAIDGANAPSSSNVLATINDLTSLGGGDMLRSVYDTDLSGVVDDSELVNGLTVETAVPVNALFTDTVYDDSTTIKSTNPLGTDNAIARADGTGRLIQGGIGTIDDAGNISGTTIDADNNSILNIGVPEFDSETIDMMGNLSGLAFDKLSLTVLEDGGLLYLDVENILGGDARFYIDGNISTLNCTTGAGVGGRARIQLVPGATVNDPTTNWVFVTDLGGVASLNVNTDTALPAGAFGWVGKLVLPDIITWQTTGGYLVQRYTEAFINDHRGTQSYTREKLRVMGAWYAFGITSSISITPNASAPDNVHLQSASGVVYQLHRQTFPAFTTGPYYYGNGINIYEQFDDLNKAVHTQDGTLVKNKERFILVIWGAVNIDDGTSKIFVNQPNGVYSNDAQALADVMSTADYTVPEGMRTVAFMISKVVFRYETNNGGTWTELGNFSLLGSPVGVRVAGSTTTLFSNEFADNQFKIFDGLDPSKLIAFQVDQLTTATTRELTIQDKDITVAGLSDIITDHTGLSSIGNNTHAQIDAHILSDVVHITSNQNDALDGANAPSAGNVLATINDLSGLGGGDMLKEVYDTNGNNIVDNAEKVNSLTVETAVPSGALFTDTLPTGLEYTTDGGGVFGWRLINEDATFSLPIGNHAINMAVNNNGLGYNTGASNDYSMTTGVNTRALGTASTSIGAGTTALNDGSFAVGAFNIGTSVDTIMEVGTGNIGGLFQNGFEVYMDGTLTAPTSTPALITSRGAKALTTVEYIDSVVDNTPTLYRDLVSAKSIGAYSIQFNNGSDFSIPNTYQFINITFNVLQADYAAGVHMNCVINYGAGLTYRMFWNRTEVPNADNYTSYTMIWTNVDKDAINYIILVNANTSDLLDNVEMILTCDLRTTV